MQYSYTPHILTLTFLVKRINIKSPIKLSRFVKIMSKEKILENIEEESPQKSLEKILKAEIQISEQISEAKEKAEKRVEASLDKVASFKDTIIEKARADREKILAKGVSDAKANAEKQIYQSHTDSETFKNSGSDFIEEAVLRVEAIILGELKNEAE